MIHLDNFVNMEEIKDSEDQIEQTTNIRLITRISSDMNKNKAINYKLNEHIVTLEDNLFNFLNLYESKVLNFLNFDDKFEETPINSS